jgi:hypothetical protein
MNVNSNANVAEMHPLNVLAHEIATLLLLLNAPVDVMAATPDVMALHEVGLVQLIASEQDEARFALTAEGNAVERAWRRLI